LEIVEQFQDSCVAADLSLAAATAFLLRQAGAYRSTEEALDAAVTAVEIAAAPGFEETQEELEGLLSEGLNTGEPVEASEAFWSRLRAETDQMAAEHTARTSRR
jgi:hypothetical protein